MSVLDPAASLRLPNLDELDPLEALQLLSELRSWVHQASDEQLVRARLHGFSWRTISRASGVHPSTTRRWVLAGTPDQIRRRS